MTYEELVKAYIKLFILVIETVGQDIGNKFYQNVKEIIERNEKSLQAVIDQEAPFYVLVSLLETLVICDIHDKDELMKDKFILQGYVNDMWTRYLKVPSNKFFRKNGLPVINEIDEDGIIMLKTGYKQ